MNSRNLPYVLKEQIELDEKYFTYCHKGKTIDGVKSKKRGTPASKRGLSDEKICILTAVERKGNSFLKAFNMARPTSEDILNLKERIENGSFVWTDGLASYNSLISEKKCDHKVVKDKNEYDAVNHLNNVNSFHSEIEKQYEYYQGVSTKYINRYCALFNLQREVMDKGPTEFLLLIKNRLRDKCIKFFIRQITKDSIFTCTPAGIPAY